MLVGVCVYGGGGIHEYELEVLADDVRDHSVFFGVAWQVSNLASHSSVRLFFPHPGTDGAPRGLGTFSPVDFSGAGEGHVQHR